MKHRGILSILAVIAVLSLLIMNKDAIMTYVMKATIELSADNEIQKFEYKELIIYYEEGQENIIGDITKLLPAIHDEQEKWLPVLHTQKKLPIFLLSQEHPLHAQYFADTKKGIYYVDLQLVLLNAEAYSPASNFVHEYAHFILDQFVEQNDVSEDLLPMWFVEGFANSFEWFVTNEASESIWHYEPLPFSELTELTNDNHIEVYSQGFHAILDLLHTNGYESIGLLIQKSSKLNSFIAAFHDVTSNDYETYHERFAFDRERIRYFHELAQNNPEQFIVEAEAFLNERPVVHPLTADLAELLYKAHFALGNVEESIIYAQQASSLTRNAFFLLDMAKTVGANEPVLKYYCIEKALFYGQQTNIDRELILQKVDETNNNS